MNEYIIKIIKSLTYALKYFKFIQIDNAYFCIFPSVYSKSVHFPYLRGSNSL